MAYLNKSLGEGEVIRYSASRHWIGYLPGLIVVTIGSLIVLGGLVISNKFGAGLIVLGATFMIISLLPLVGVWLENSTTELAITNKKVIAKWGFISRKTLEQRLEKVDSIQVDQSMTGRFFDYGTIIVHGSGSSTTPIKAIANPLEFRRQVENAVAGLGHPKG